MGRLCGGAHEISGIKAPLFLHGGWLEDSWGWVGGGDVGDGVGGCILVGLVVGWVVGWDGSVVGSGWMGGVMGSGWVVVCI